MTRRGGSASEACNCEPQRQAAALDGNESSNSYRVSHQAPGYGSMYNETFEGGYYAALWQKIERPLVEDILRPLGGPTRRCLDFACGTGRIACVAAEYFRQVVGVDVSPAMIQCASVAENVSLRIVDITREDMHETFDVATAFRFFLNAEDALKREALSAIRRHLRDGGYLVCNIHMNAASPAGFLYRRGKAVFGERTQNTLGLEAFCAYLSEAGFVVEDVRYYGYLPRLGPLMTDLCEHLVEPAERLCRALAVPGRFAQNFVVVARSLGRDARAAPFQVGFRRSVQSARAQR
ncbi:MAG: class I SAM-dependent methyltransferase [Pseudomonadota bacterium]